MKVQCCVCKKVRVGTKWVAPNGQTVSAERVSHGYCPACADRAFEEIKACFGSQTVASPAA